MSEIYYSDKDEQITKPTIEQASPKDVIRI
jgi:hypothetical protein